MSEENTLHLDLPASHIYLNALGGCIAAMLQRAEDLPDPQTTIYNIQLAVHEICTNIIEHAYANSASDRIKISLTLCLRSGQFITDVYDTGRACDLSKVAPPNLEQGQIHGYGLFIVRQLMDTVTLQSQPGNNHWHLAKNLFSGD